jgi:benzoate-CoA ligase family protein
MRVAVIGAGPAGLFFALLLKRKQPQHDVIVIEQNRRDATFGFGVVFSIGALEFLSGVAPEMYAALTPSMESWPIQRIVHRDVAVDIDGNGFSAVGRMRLLQILQKHAEDAGVRIEFGQRIDSMAPLGDFDLVVAADGVNSLVRHAMAETFCPHIERLTNRFIWYGTRQRFDCLTLTFRSNEHGAFVAHHYRYSPEMSTFIVECGAATWYRAGLDRMSEPESRTYCERVFASDLGGHPLESNKSVWRNFLILQNERWSSGNVCLIGDALRTVHFSIGSGTRLAFDDAIALAGAFESADAVPGEVLAQFEKVRRPVVEKLVDAANQSSYWYERLSDKMQLEPWQLAYDYMKRSGRMSDERLREQAPQFMQLVEAHCSGNDRLTYPERIPDPVPRNANIPGNVSFSIPEHYNASEILFANLTAGRADKTALFCDARRVSYLELCKMSCRAGNGLRQFGLSRGSRVLLLLHDTPEYIAAIFGAIRAGFVPILVNTMSPPELIAYYLEDSGAEAAICEGELCGLLLDPGVARSRARHVVTIGPRAADLTGASFTVHEWQNWVQSQLPDLPAADTHRDEMAFWMYSSGSTGRPKGVVHLQHDAPYTYEAYGKRVLGIREDDIVFSPPKIFFAYGFGNSLTFPFSVGASTILHPGRPDPESVFATIERHRPTILFGLPTLYNALTSHSSSEKRDLSSLRLCISAAETLPSELFNEWRRRYGLSVVEGLGSTELLHIFLSNRIDKQIIGTSGAPVPGYEVRLTDLEGKPVLRGESGVMSVRGDSQAPYYWNRPDKTSETMRDGWIWTGDRFREDDHGYYTFEGRADDLIKVSGQWVYPLEIERCLANNPMVRECVVLAVEDENRLTTIAAYVVLRDNQPRSSATTQQLQKFVKDRLLPFKYPRRVEYLESLPKTGTGKIDRQALRALGSTRDNAKNNRSDI